MPLSNRSITYIFLMGLAALAVSAVYAYTPLALYGQADATSGAPNRGGTAGADTFNYPLGIEKDADGGMYVADRNNHRVLYFANDGDTTADKVYGQFGDFTAHISNNNGSGNSGAPSADNLSMPTAVALDSAGGLFVADRDNHRVLYFAPDGDTTADRVYGQASKFTTNMVQNDGAGNYSEPSADNLGTYILGLAVDSQDGLYVSDSSNHRVLYFANDGDTTADRVYGQFGDLTTNARNNDGSGRRGTPSADSLNFPRGIAVDANDGLYIADRDNNRVLYFNPGDDTTADRVFGQYGNFNTNVESNDGSGNVGTPNADNFSHPKDIGIGPEGGVYVSDTLHHRILYFRNDGNTTAEGTLGQFMNLTTGAANNDGSGADGTPSMDNLKEPQGVFIDAAGVIYITDTGNNRLLVFDCPQWK